MRNQRTRSMFCNKRLLISIFMLGALVLPQTVFQVKADDTVYIKPDGTIAPAGAPISTVDKTVYSLTANVYSEIVIQRNHTIIDGHGYTVQGSGGGYGFNLNSVSNVTIKNTTVKSFLEGIWAYGSSMIQITENNITDNSLDGITLYSSSENNITKNTIRNSDYAIFLLSSSKNHIDDNELRETSFGGVWLDGQSDGNTLTGNKFIGSGLLVSFSYGNNVDGNSVNDNPLVYLENVSDMTVNDAGQVVLVGCTNIRAEELDLSNTAVGLELWQSNNCTIVDNNMTYDHYGIWLCSSSQNEITGNRIANNEKGVHLWLSSNNTFYSNNFANNTNHVLDDSWNDPELPTSHNTWNKDYPSGGNYWNDYLGTDNYHGSDQKETGSDGIGDKPQNIHTVVTDNYPLLGMFSDFDTANDFNIQIVSNSSISSFQFNGSAIIFNTTGQEGDAGFSRTCIPKALLDKPYKIFVNGEEVPFTLLQSSDSNYLYFSYQHSTKQVLIIPEFHSLAIALIVTALSVTAIILFRKKKSLARAL